MPPLPPSLSPLNAVLTDLQALAEEARAYARTAQADQTRRAYAADWRAYTRWCARNGLDPLPRDPQVVGLYITALASGAAGPKRAPATIERRLAGIAWHARQRGCALDRADPHIREVLAGIRRRHARPPVRKEALDADDIVRMLDTLPTDLRGLRDRAMLLVGFAGGLRRGEIVGLDLGPDQTADGRGWVEVRPEGLLLHIQGKTGWREVAVGPGSRARTCPMAALKTWLRFARLAHGPVFRRVSRDGRRALSERPSDRHVARLVQTAALAAGLRGDLPEGERRALFGGHSLRAGLATSAAAEERHVQRALGHSSAEMTRRYQRQRDRFAVNLTKAVGL